MKKKILWYGLSFLLVVALVLASCGEAVPGEQEEEQEEESAKAMKKEEEEEKKLKPADPKGEEEEPVGEEEEEDTPPATKGPAEILALEASDIGPGWERLCMDVKADGNWIDQTFHHRYIEDELEYTEQVTQIIRVYPDIESALLDSELCERRYRISLWEEQLEELTEAESYSREFLEAQIEQATSGLPLWDEAYKNNRTFLRKDNVIVIFATFRMIRRDDPLMGYTPILSHLLTPEQEQWLDEENYVDELLFDLAEKAEGILTRIE